MGSPSTGFQPKAAVVQAQKAEKERLRREDYLRVKHDKLFSDWKILVGKSDWKDHAAGVQGAQRYKVHNLPATYFGPGVYELGLTQQASLATQETKARKIRRDAVVVVYLGQADNVRQRLQRYGQTGSHLEGTRPASASAMEDHVFTHQPALQPLGTRATIAGFDTELGSKETGRAALLLFTEVFSRGYSIAFRWARTESKQLAERVESELLHVFDYPWNTALNGARRPRDILAKLEMYQYHVERRLGLGRVLDRGWRKLEYLGRDVGISVAVRKPTEGVGSNRAHSKFSVFVSSTNKAEEIVEVARQSSSICGVLLEDGSLCQTSPRKGCKRCGIHKGQRVKLSTRQLQSRTTKGTIGQVNTNLPTEVTIKAKVRGKRVYIAELSSSRLVCGATTDTGSQCLNPPVKGRKRCSDHKGVHVTSTKATAKVRH